MKKIIIGIGFITLIASQALFANPKIFKPHKGKAGPDAASINCAYCHGKSAIPKTKGQDVKQITKGPNCTTSECHK